MLPEIPLKSKSQDHHHQSWRPIGPPGWHRPSANVPLMEPPWRDRSLAPRQWWSTTKWQCKNPEIQDLRDESRWKHLLRDERGKYNEIRWNEVKGDFKKSCRRWNEINWHEMAVEKPWRWTFLCFHSSYMEVLVYWCPFLLPWMAVASGHWRKTAECETLITMVSCIFHAIKK